MRADAVYVDSSVLVSFCLRDPVIRERVDSFLKGIPLWITSAISEVEIQSGIAFQFSNDPENQFRAEQNLNRLLFEFQILHSSADVLREARSMVRRYRLTPGLRTLDAIHLASASLWQREARDEGMELVFLTADRRQASSFTAEGFRGFLL